MRINPGFLVNKLLRAVNRPALRDCSIDRTAKVGTGSNCIGVTMGRYSYMGKNSSVADTTIGAFCSIASYCAIGGAAHPIEMVSTSPVFFEGRNVFGRHFARMKAPGAKPVVIGNDVWIGEGVFIKEGITVGDGAVIGAHSVVTRNIPPYAVAAGAPAGIIRYRFDEKEIAKLRRLKWWDWPEEKLEWYGERFSSAARMPEENER